MLGQFGVTLNETATVFARLFGSALLAFPVLLWFARRSDTMGIQERSGVRHVHLLPVEHTHPDAHPDAEA